MGQNISIIIYPINGHEYHYLSLSVQYLKINHESIHIPISCFGSLDPLKPLMTSEFPGAVFFRIEEKKLPSDTSGFSGELLMYTPCSS